MEGKNQRNRIVGVRLTLVEFEKIEKKWKASNCRKLSDFIRKMIFQKPIVASYRNKSMDDFMAEAIRLRSELNGIGNNFNQLVKKLHMTPRTEGIEKLLVSYELDKRSLLRHIEKIQLFIEEQGAKW
ncbi:plasmid mobilization relaxosome protein MobC [Pedobacter sp. UBA4863]|uniref:plasmid mobilization protein n=1 Tax=Pedobacter sp. UBA4863 TaxID=1947060 RepID=UPI0025F5905D|nr:plasmid mobilization relaxosome protein MobC [Pedobacter sp. UBA4863]